MAEGGEDLTCLSLLLSLAILVLILSYQVTRASNKVNYSVNFVSLLLLRKIPGGKMMMNKMF